MGLFNKFKKTSTRPGAAPAGGATISYGGASISSGRPSAPENPSGLAALALNTISDGVMIIGADTKVQFLNPAAANMLGYLAEGILGLELAVVFHLETGEGMMLEEATNPFLIAAKAGTSYVSRSLVLLNAQNRKHPISLSITPIAGHNERIITFRDISKELEEEGAQMEFISTASHEMRTPVASIEGYLGLALNPDCATIDERARKYLEQAHTSSRHLGKLFQDLLDVTKLDDSKIRVNPVPVDVAELVKQIADGWIPTFNEANIHYTYGPANHKGGSSGARSLSQPVYASIDVDFLREIINNLLENAVKYNQSGGGIWVNVRGDGDRVLINVTDTGIGISPDDLKHIFQKFYRADNSQTRTIGGTGLGLYLVKARTEAMSGKVWAESSFGEGSTFYVSFPRLSIEEFEKRKMLALNGQV